MIQEVQQRLAGVALPCTKCNDRVALECARIARIALHVEAYGSVSKQTFNITIRLAYFVIVE